MSETIIEEIEHSVLGASGAHRWMRCAGSVNLIRKLVRENGPKALDTDDDAAAEGTAAHQLAQECLTDDVEAWTRIGHRYIVKGQKFVVDAEMAEGVQLHVNTVHRLLAEYADDDPELYVERTMKTALDDEGFGTADVIIHVPDKVLIVVDFKFGYVVVEPSGEQNRYYAKLAVEDLGFTGDQVRCLIVQPRAAHEKGPVREHVATRADIEAWFEDEVLPAMAATRDPEAGYVVGRHCRFCPARENCPAFHQELVNFDTTLDPVYLTDEELGEAMVKIDLLVRMKPKLAVEAFRRAKDGAAIPGYKVVKKKANREFRPLLQIEDEEGHVTELTLEAEALATFGEDAYTDPVLRSPPQLEKLPGGKEFVRRWAFKPNAGLTLAPETDSRSAVAVQSMRDLSPVGSVVT